MSYSVIIPFYGSAICDGYKRQNKFSNHPFLGFVKAVKNTKSNKEVKMKERKRDRDR